MRFIRSFFPTFVQIAIEQTRLYIISSHTSIISLKGVHTCTVKIRCKISLVIFVNCTLEKWYIFYIRFTNFFSFGMKNCSFNKNKLLLVIQCPSLVRLRLL